MCDAEEWDEAREEIGRLKQHSPLRAGEQQLWEAAIALGRGELDEAVRLSRISGLKTALVTEAIALAKMGHAEEARAVLGAAISHRAPGAERAMGQILEIAGDLPGAIEWYERALGRADRAEALERLGDVLRDLGDVRDAAWAYAESLRWGRLIRPQSVLRLAECWRRMGRLRRAASLEAALAPYDLS